MNKFNAVIFTKEKEIHTLLEIELIELIEIINHFTEFNVLCKFEGISFKTKEGDSITINREMTREENIFFNKYFKIINVCDSSVFSRI